MDDYMSVSQVAAAIGVSHGAILARIRAGDIRAVRVHPRLWLIPAGEVDRWRARGKLQPWAARRLRESAE